MRNLIGIATIFAVVLAAARPAAAGLYNPQELTYLYPVPSSFDQFQIKLSDLRGLARQPDRATESGSTERSDANENEWIKQYRHRFEELQAAEKAGKLSISDRVDLSARYLRIPNRDGTYKTDQAIRVLEPALADEPRNFMVLANLAVAHQLAGNLERAVSYESLALEAWPDAYPGLTAEQLRWFRRAEKYYYLLLISRMRETEQRTRPEEKAVDPLFSPVDLVRAGGGYEVGRISPRQWAELPGDAVPIVEQLLFWLPLDNRLYWLLGEILNARGDDTKRDVRSAYQIFNTLVNPPGQGQTTTPGQPFPSQADQPRLLRHHWKLLEQDPRAHEEDQIETTAGPSLPKEAAPAKPDTGWVPDLRAVGVGFAAGVLVSLLAALQVRELRRRKEMRPGQPASGVG